MYDEDVQYLKDCLAAGLIVWLWLDSGYTQIIRIVDGIQRHEEEGPCGYLSIGLGQYVAFDAADPDEIKVTSPFITKFPSLSKD